MIDNILSATRRLFYGPGSEPTQNRSEDTPRYTLSLATTPERIRQAQALRKLVFSQQMIAKRWEDGSLDYDEFDIYCQHLVVIENSSDQVVGTYRLLSSERARRAGKFYSESCFRFLNLGQHRSDLIELGRSCVHPDHRDGAVLRMLWRGISEMTCARHEKYVIGCASVSASDGGLWGAAIYNKLIERHRAPAEFSALALNPLSPDKFSYKADPVIPPLILSYLKIGAQICAEPHHDVEFGSVDFLLIAPSANLTVRRRSRSA